ncbi:MAG: hypothetical protein QW041_02050 [Candidatus Pacearchaeota archaeon]
MTDECEYCGEQAEYDVLIDGNYIRVCKKCLNDDMVIIEKPTKEQINFSYKRPTVRQILSKMSGAPTNYFERIPNPPPSLSLLRQPTKESIIKKRLTNLKLESPDQSRIVQQREPKQPSISLTKEKKEEIESEDDFLDI